MKKINPCKNCKAQMQLYYSRWMSLNFSITFMKFCEYAGFGTKRANAAFYEILNEMKKFDDRDNYKYNLAELQNWFDKMQIPFDTGSSDGLVELQAEEKKLKSKEKQRNSASVSIQEAYEAQKQLEMMKQLMRGNT